MSIKTGDYVLASIDNKKKLVHVTGVGDGKFNGVLDHNRAYAPENVKYKLSSVVANLGPDPAPGAAYGCLIEPYRRSFSYKDWGDIHTHVKADKAIQEAIRAGLDKTYAILKKYKLTGFLPIDIEIRPKKGVHAGSWTRSKKDKRSLMILRSREDCIAMYPQLVMHEAAHGIWYNCVPLAYKAKWIKLYHSYLRFSNITVKDLESIKDSFFDQPQPVREFQGQLEEEDAFLFKKVLDWIKDNHRMTTRHLDEIVLSGETEFLEKLWPTYEMLVTDCEVVISDYARKSVEEFFAEAVSFHLMSKIKLPKKIVTAVEKTLQASK
jgi:hypothetical protein